VQYRV